MRLPVRVFSISALLLAASLGLASAQTNPQSGPQSGTLEVPAHRPHERAEKPPSAAPRVPVHTDRSRTPIVPPHGQVHPHKPPAKAAAAPATPPAAAQSGAAQSGASQSAASAAASVETRPPEKLPDPEKPEGVPAKLPRFASLRADEVNMRAGPGTRYRIDWVYKRRDLPVEIEREFDVWRWVRDADGIQGWVHQATLMWRRSFIVQKADATLRAEASDSAGAVAILKPGVIGRIRSCEAASDWCDVQTGSYRGYLRREQFWGLLPGEAINP
jgi:SH3-like domain-containing protein